MLHWDLPGTLLQRLSLTTSPSGFADSLRSWERACASLIQTAETKPNTYTSQYRKQVWESRFNVFKVKQQQQKPPDALWITYFIVPKQKNVLDWRQLYTDQTHDLHEAKSPGRKRRRGLLWLGQDSYLCQGELRKKQVEAEQGTLQPSCCLLCFQEAFELQVGLSRCWRIPPSGSHRVLLSELPLAPGSS